MIKRIASLLLVAFVFTGAWWDEKKTNTATPAPSYNETQETSDAVSDYQEPAEETSEQAPAVASAPGTASNTAAALKVLSEGNPDERKARMESLVRLSQALRKQRELKGEQQAE